MEIKRGNKQLIKRINKNSILHHVLRKHQASRVEIAGVLGLTTATVTNLVTELIEEDFLKESGNGISRGGRRPVILEISPSHTFLGVYAGADALRIATYDLNGESEVILYSGAVPEEYDAFIALLSEKLQTMETRYPQIKSAGLAVHGLVDPREGRILFSPRYGWKNRNLADDLQGFWSKPLHIENDARSMALAEKWFGTTEEEHDLVLIHVDRGIGAALMLNNRLYQGHNFGAGEIGHIPLPGSDALCSCGNRGCFEAEAGVPALLERYQKKTGVSVSSIREMTERGPLPSDFIKETADTYSRALTFIVNVLNPARIVLTGEVTALGSLFLEALREGIERHRLPNNRTELTALSPRQGELIKTRGAAALAIENLFSIHSQEE